MHLYILYIFFVSVIYIIYILYASEIVIVFINWLKKNSKQTLFDIFERKLGLIQELGQLIIWCLVRNVFMEKIYRKSALKASAIPPFFSPFLVNSTKQNRKCIQDTHILFLSSSFFPFVSNWLRR